MRRIFLVDSATNCFVDVYEDEVDDTTVQAVEKKQLQSLDIMRRR